MLCWYWCSKFDLQSSILVLNVNNSWTSSLLNCLSLKYGCLVKSLLRDWDFLTLSEVGPFHEDMLLHAFFFLFYQDFKLFLWHAGNLIITFKFTIFYYIFLYNFHPVTPVYFAWLSYIYFPYELISISVQYVPEIHKPSNSQCVSQWIDAQLQIECFNCSFWVCIHCFPYQEIEYVSTEHCARFLNSPWYNLQILPL